jgi:hypothetical protein
MSDRLYKVSSLGAISYMVGISYFTIFNVNVEQLHLKLDCSTLTLNIAKYEIPTTYEIAYL